MVQKLYLMRVKLYLYRRRSSGRKILLKDAIELMGKDILGKEIMEKYGGWTMFAKFFDNMDPLPHHLHLDDEKAARVGQKESQKGIIFPSIEQPWRLFPYTFLV